MSTKEKNLLDLLESETARMLMDCVQELEAQVHKLKMARSVACEKISRDVLADIRSTLAGYSAWSDEFRVEFVTDDRRERDRYGNRIFVNMARHAATKSVQAQINALEKQIADKREHIKKHSTQLRQAIILHGRTPAIAARVESFIAGGK